MAEQHNVNIGRCLTCDTPLLFSMDGRLKVSDPGVTHILTQTEDALTLTPHKRDCPEIPPGGLEIDGKLF